MKSKLFVKFLGDEDDETLSLFLDVLSRESLSVLGYHYPFYRDMLCRVGVGEPLYLGAFCDSELVGFLPAFRKESEIGIVYSSLPFFGPNAGVLCRKGHDEVEIHTLLIKALLTIAKDDGAISCSIYTPFNFQEFSIYDSIIPQAIVVEKMTQYLDLSETRWSQKIKYDLRRATKLGVSICSELTEERVDRFYEIYQQNCYEYGIPLKPRGCLDFLFDKKVLGKHARIYFAFLHDQMVGGLLVLFSPTTLSYYIPCTNPDYKTCQSGTLLIDKACSDAQEDGKILWNWESSPSVESGVYQFKKKWGAQVGYYRIYIEVFSSDNSLSKLSKSEIAQSFPWFYVYPYERLNKGS